MVKLWAIMEKVFFLSLGEKSHGLYELNASGSGCPKKFLVYLRNLKKKNMIFIKKNMKFHSKCVFDTSNW